MLTVFCDFDGPLVDVSERYYHTYRQALSATQARYGREAIGLTPLSKAQFWQRKRERACDLEMALRSGLGVEHVGYFVARVKALVNHPDLLSKDRFQSGVDWALALLHSRGSRLILVTLRCREQVEEMLCSHGLTRLFAGIYGANDCGAAYRNNAEHKTALLAEAMTACAPAEACFIGDTEADILAARAAAVPTIALTCGIRSRSYLQQYAPDAICPDLPAAARHLLVSRSSSQDRTPLTVGRLSPSPGS